VEMVAGAGFEPALRGVWDRCLTAWLPRRGDVWRGVPVLPRGAGVLETPLRRLAPAAFLVLENGAASRNRTGISWLEARGPALERWPQEIGKAPPHPGG
jgi:hypothetical protein